MFNDVPLVRAKVKQVYIDALSETLTKLFPSSSYFKTNVDTNMGFLLGESFNGARLRARVKQNLKQIDGHIPLIEHLNKY